ncbi:PrgI family protein [Candidatus Woesebacteria bacterium]|nr:PrgI family protein [Candidatus Woesebacteria bacterium]
MVICEKAHPLERIASRGKVRSMEIEQEHLVPQQISSYQFRLVGDMTLKQFFQLAGGILLALVIYAIPIHPIIKWPLIIFFVIFGAALAFMPIKERPLSKWIFIFFKSVYSPTRYSWRKPTKPFQFFQPEPEEIPTPTPEPSSHFTPDSKKLEEAEKTFLTKITKLSASGTQPSISSTQVPQEAVLIPKVEPVRTELQGYQPKITKEEKPIEETQFLITPTLGQGREISKLSAQFSQIAALPNPPSEPNIVTGQVTDSEGKIIEAAILEIKDSAGRPVRALKTNKAGHFLIVTPLLSGKYELITEKEGFVFDQVTFEAKGEIIPPILIKAKSTSTLVN